MNHSQRTIEVRSHGQSWFRMPKSCYVFTDKESRKLARGEIVTKWDMEFRKRPMDILAALEDSKGYKRQATVLRVWNKKLAEQRKGTKATPEHKQAISKGLKRAWDEGRRSNRKRAA